MTHIAGHPPTIGGSFISMSPLYKMAGYLFLDNGKGSATKHRVFFINNTGYTFKKGEKIGFHLQLIPIRKDNKEFKDVKGDWAAIAYDLVPYKEHEEIEKEVMKGGKIENARVEYIEECAKGKQGMAKMILEQTARFMKSQSFKTLYPEYKGNIPRWIEKNVVDLDVMTRLMIGSGSKGGNEVIIDDFPAFLKENLNKESK